MIYITLYIVFFRIGLFSFGGGLAMLPLIEKELLIRGWMTRSEFLDLVSISQMTPGAIAVNASTYVGNSTAGFLGGIFATVGVITPSILIILILSNFILKLKKSHMKTAFFYGMKPVSIGLVTYAGYIIGKSTYFIEGNIVWHTLLISIVSGCIFLKFKFNPIFIIVLSGILGYIIL